MYVHESSWELDTFLTHQWEHGTIRGLGWSDQEELLVITEDGTVRRYFGLYGDFTSFSLGNVSAQVD
jgi:hypothetical protein